MKKKIIVGVAAWLFVTGILYLSFGLANKSFNIFEWGWGDRGFALTMWCVITVIPVIMFAAFYLSEDKT